MGDRHRAPRRKVRNVKKVGFYKTTEWVIALECGHTERRKRSPKSDHIGCAACVNDERLLINVLRMPSEEPVASVDPDNQVLFDAAKMTANIASLLKIPSEMVDVRVTATASGLKIEGASIWIPGDSLKFLT